MGDPNKPVIHKLKFVDGYGFKIAQCGKTVHDHVVTIFQEEVTCRKCLNQQEKNSEPLEEGRN